MTELVLTSPETDPNDLGPPKPWQDPNPCVRVFGPGPEGVRCKKCALLYRVQPGSNYYWKCRMRRETCGPGSDHRVNWNACAKFEMAAPAEKG